MATAAPPRIREIQEPEVAHYRENGWAFLKGLISAEFARELLQRARTHMGYAGEGHVPRAGQDNGTRPWRDYRAPSNEDALYRALAFAPEIGRSAERLMG